MTPQLRAALVHCRSTGGLVCGHDTRDPNRYVLKLCASSMRAYRTFRLSWAGYREAFIVWQELVRPQKGHAFEREKAA